MSEASASHLHTMAQVLVRAFVLVVGAFALVLLAPHAARALDPGTANEAAEEVGSATAGSTEIANDTGDDVVDAVVESAGPAADAAEAVNQAAME